MALTGLLTRNTCSRALFWIIFFFLFTRVKSIELTEFDKEYVGTVFEPYTKFHNDKSDYEMNDVQNMLKIVSPRFRRISTYGMGTTGAEIKWSDGDAAGKSAVAAANINRNLSRLELIVNIGTWQHDLLNREIDNAFEAANAANKLFNGTVAGIIITSHYDNLMHISELLNKYMNQSQQSNVKLGIRSSQCGGLLGKSRQSDPVALNLIQNLSFIICHRLPNKETNITKVVIEIGRELLQWKKDFKNINEDIETILETGWPSDGNIGASQSFSIENQKQFWFQMAKWAKENRIRVDMFTAFDEPWKINLGQGLHQVHYGWWMRIKNDSSGPEAFIEKINYTKPAPPARSYALEISLSLVGIILFGALIAFIVFLYTKLRAIENDALTKADIEQFEKGISKDDCVDPSTEDALRLPYDRSYEMSKNKFLIDRANVLGSGTFGVVFKGKLDGIDNDVAFKMTQSNCSATSLKSLLSEIKIMIHVGKHPNVVSILGAYTGEMRQGTIIIAIELCPAGCLEKCLRSYKNSYCNIALQDDSARYVNAQSQFERRPVEQLMRNLIKWSYEIACGMEHITSKNVIHADLATRNVLLTSDETAKITDFGLSRRLYEYTNYVKQNQEPMPWRWMAPESLKQMAFSSKSDVWSYGVTLWEIWSLGDIPFPGLAWNMEFSDELENGLRMHKPNNASPEIYNIMVDCWKHLPKDRPDFTSLIRSFRELMCEPTRKDSFPYTNLTDDTTPLIS